MSEVAPYAFTRTWHVQLAVLWIATAWLGAGLYLAPLIAGSEPPLQRLGVDALWAALVIAVLGSLAGEWLTLTGNMTDPALVYWFGHQGYEYLDMGRFWQLLIFAGLLIWRVFDDALPGARHPQSGSRQTPPDPVASLFGRIAHTRLAGKRGQEGHGRFLTGW